MKRVLLTIMLIALLPTQTFADSSNDKATKEIMKLINYYSSERNLPPELVYQVIDVESDFNVKTNNIHGNYADQGLMQLNSQWNKGRLVSNYIKNFNPFNPDHNINMGTYLLSSVANAEKKKGYSGKKLWDRVLTVYNAGYGYLYKYGIRNKYVKQFNYDFLSQEKQIDREEIQSIRKESQRGFQTREKCY